MTDTPPPAWPSFRRAPIVTGALLATLAPLTLLVANRDWFFTPEGFLDPWQYVGFFRYYEDLDYSPRDYKVGRLPWILLGYGITKALPTMASAYFLHALFLCATPLMLFGAMYSLFRRPALATVVALIFGFYAHGHGSGGWDYHNTPSGFLFFATLWLCVVPAAVRGSPSVWTLAGGMGALTLHTNITLVNLVPVLAVIHVAVVRERTSAWLGVRPLAVRAGWALLGALLATALLGTVHWIVGRGFAFFAILINIILRSDVQGDDPLFDFFSWARTANYLSLPAALFVAGAVSLIHCSHSSRLGVVSRALILQFVVMGLLWVLWQAAGYPALDWNYLTYGLLLSAVAALAGILESKWPRPLERHWLSTMLGTTVVLAASLIAGLPAWSRSLEQLLAPATFVGGSLVFLVPLLAFVWRPAAGVTAMVIAALAVGNRLVAPSPVQYAAADPCKMQPAVYAGIVEGASRLFSIDPLFTRERIWFDEGEMISPLKGCPVDLGYMSYSMKAMSSVGYVTEPHPMPDVGDVPADAILALKDVDAFLTIITNDDGNIAKWDRRLEELGLAREEVARFRVPVMESGFGMQAWRIRSRP